MKTTNWYLSLIALSIALILAACAPKPQSKQADTSGDRSSQPGDYYTCPMHPWVRSDKPGACPVCHMTLVKVSSTGARKGANETVVVTSAGRILANISTAFVENRALTREVFAVGKIDVPEPNAQQISSRFGGRIERLLVSFVGQKVNAGEPIAEIYSPDAMAAQREFLVARGSPDGGSGDSTLLKQARLKLKLLGFTDAQLDQIAKDQKPSTFFTIHSPISGTIVKKNVDIQRYVSAGESLFDVADLRTVWLQLDVYDNDISLLHVGQVVEASIDALPSLTIEGKITFISPTLDPTARTTRVRAILDNTSGHLKPEMYAHATIRVPLTKSLVVPSTAVISNGKRDIVWVEREPGQFEPRLVTLGERSGEFYQILRGLREGETIAVTGSYLIDSESQLQATSGGDKNQ